MELTNGSWICLLRAGNNLDMPQCFRSFFSLERVAAAQSLWLKVIELLLTLLGGRDPERLLLVVVEVGGVSGCLHLWYERRLNLKIRKINDASSIICSTKYCPPWKRTNITVHKCWCTCLKRNRLVGVQDRVRKLRKSSKRLNQEDRDTERQHSTK